MNSELASDDLIYVAGHRGLAGSAIVRALQQRGFTRILTRTHAELDLEDAQATRQFFETHRPQAVLLAAAKVGGIHANNVYPVDFLVRNLAIQSHVIQSAAAVGVKRLVFLGSSCIYPREAEIPIKESSLLTGPLEATNRPYALAKIAGIEMCWSYNRQYGTQFLAAMPTNLYGPGDNYDLQNSHVLPALIRKMHEAKLAGRDTVELWGSGKPMREFLYSDDLGRGLVHLACLPQAQYQALTQADVCPLINVGTGTDMTIAELAEVIARQVGFTGRFVFDPSKPDGTMRKVMDVQRILALGWKPSVSIDDGIQLAYQDFLARHA